MSENKYKKICIKVLIILSLIAFSSLTIFVIYFNLENLQNELYYTIITGIYLIGLFITMNNLIADCIRENLNNSKSKQNEKIFDKYVEILDKCYKCKDENE